MLLLELFDKILPWDWFEQTFERTRAKFTTPNGQNLVVYFHAYEEPTEEYPNDPKLVELEFNNMGVGENRLRIGTSKITNSGEQFLIFATVLDVANQYAEEHPTTSIHFGATEKEPTRVKLYKKMMKRFIPNATTYMDGGELMFVIPPKEPRAE